MSENQSSDEHLIIDCNAAVGTGVCWEPKNRPVKYDPEILLKYSAEAGIHRSCIMSARHVPWVNTSFYLQQNREVAALCKKHPDKFIGLAVHNPQAEAGTLRKILFEEVRSLGLRGLRSDGHPTREMLDVVAELNIPVMYYPNLTGFYPPESSGSREFPGPTSAYFLMATTYPSVNFILPHLGCYRSVQFWTSHIEAMGLAKRFPNVYLETSGVMTHKWLEMAGVEVPAEKLLFGSNAPEEDPRVEIHNVKLLKLGKQKEAAVFGENIRRLLRL
ncbi:MAG: amidohydrolase family protein [Terriglobia bacterium]|jgi:predicted TIM-barrel fold metal-dependent hydrolase